MTVCVAALCERRRALVLVSDKMIGMGLVQTELKIEKVRRLCPDWWIMMAGDDVSLAFDVTDYAQSALTGRPRLDSGFVIGEVEKAYRKRRDEDAEALYLSPIGWSLSLFQSEGGLKLHPALHQELQGKLRGHRLPIELIVAGFDTKNVGHIFSIHHPGVHKNWSDVPGFYAIGSGKYIAQQMMLYREPNISMKLPNILYFAFEAKIFSEESPGVGVDSDIYIAKAGGKHQKIGPKTEKTLENVWKKVRPRLPVLKEFNRLSEVRKLLAKGD
jgi:20S proteasome alpha/beta subunit